MMSYAIEKAKEEIVHHLEAFCGTADIEVKTPAPAIKADWAVPLFKIAQKKQQKPAQFVKDLAEKLDLKNSLFSGVEAAGGYLNFQLDYAKYSQLVFCDFQELNHAYGSAKLGEGKTIVIDYSSPNIAKPFSVGHLRSTIIGHALYNIFTFLGYKVIGDNHLGDWGTQFGKLMYAYKAWGDKEKINASPITELLKLYIKFHEEAENNPTIEDEGRLWFKKLESGDPEAVALWKWFTEMSWKAFQRVYDLLHVQFDEVLGESFYNDKLQEITKEALDKGLAVWSEVSANELVAAEEVSVQSGKKDPGEEREQVALIPLDGHGITTPLLIQKSDGTSLYATRDLCTAKYRINRWNPAEIIYVVGGEQQLYFRQMFKTLELMGYKTKCVHVWFGLVRLLEGKMSTRKGRVILLEEVLDEAINRAKKILEDRSLREEEKNQIAKIIGIGAVKYADLSQNRTKDIVFDWKKMLNMKGDSAPYLQFAYVRIQSILRKAGEAIDIKLVDGARLHEAKELELIKAISHFPEVVQNAARAYYPNDIANYLFSLAQKFSNFYESISVLKAQNQKLKQTRLYLCQMTAQVLQNGLALLGIQVPERM